MVSGWSVDGGGEQVASGLHDCCLPDRQARAHPPGEQFRPVPGGDRDRSPRRPAAARPPVPAPSPSGGGRRVPATTRTCRYAAGASVAVPPAGQPAGDEDRVRLAQRAQLGQARHRPGPCRTAAGRRTRPAAPTSARSAPAPPRRARCAARRRPRSSAAPPRAGPRRGGRRRRRAAARRPAPRSPPRRPGADARSNPAPAASRSSLQASSSPKCVFAGSYARPVRERVPGVEPVGDRRRPARRPGPRSPRRPGQQVVRGPGVDHPARGHAAGDRPLAAVRQPVELARARARRCRSRTAADLDRHAAAAASAGRAAPAGS